MAEQMKPSGIDWIGEIPCSWNIKRIKYLAQLKGRIGWQGLTSDEYTDVGPFLITGVDFSNGGINWENCVHITEERWAEAPEIHIKNGDLLITKDGTVGKVAIVENLQGKASLNSGVLLIKTSNDYNKKFLYCCKRVTCFSKSAAMLSIWAHSLSRKSAIACCSVASGKV